MKRTVNTIKFVGLSLLGIFLFFVNVDINGTSGIPTQHIINWITGLIGPAIPYLALAVVVYGAFRPFVTKNWNTTRFSTIFSLLKLLGMVTAAMATFHFGPSFITDLLPSLWDDIVLPLVVMISVTGIAYIPLIYYGLVEFLAKLMQPVMKKIWKTPGESAVDAITSFAAGYSLAMMLTNEFYKKGIYSRRQAFIIATGFSTVATGFLVVIANILGLMEHWNLFFFTCLFVTFAVTAITARLYPSTHIPEDYYQQKAPEPPVKKSGKNLLCEAWQAGVRGAEQSEPLTTHLKNYYLRDATNILASICAGIMSVGLIGLMIAEYTPVFDWMGYLFYPFTALIGLPEPLLAAKAAAVELAEMFLCTPLVVNASIQTKFVVAVNSVTAVLFMSASIPSLLSMDIAAKIPHLLLVWFERTVLSILMAGVVAIIAF